MAKSPYEDDDEDDSCSPFGDGIFDPDPDFSDYRADDTDDPYEDDDPYHDSE